MFECPACTRSFSQQRGLTRHLTACKVSNKDKFLTCEGCRKTFAIGRTFEDHEKICPNLIPALRAKLTQANEEISCLTKAIQHTKITNQTNCNNKTSNKTNLNNSLNTVINVLNFDIAALESLQLKHVSGENSFADFLLKHVIKGDILKTDAARGTITYRLNDGEPPIKDAKGVQLAEKICDFSHDRVTSLNSEAIDRVVRDAGCHRALFEKIVESQQFVQGLVDKEVNCVEKLGKEIVRRAPTPANKKTFTKFIQKVEEWRKSQSFYETPLRQALDGFIDTIDEKIFVLNDSDQWIESPEVLMLCVKEAVLGISIYEFFLTIECNEPEREKIRSWIVIDSCIRGDFENLQKYFY